MKSRLGWVDGLKGISAIIVVLQHTLVTLLGISSSTTYRLPIIHNLWDGNFAVSVFIILSTILICHGIEQHREQLLERYRYIVMKRYFRLVIPVGTVIVIMYLLNIAGLFYAEELGAKTGNRWLMNTTETLAHLPGNILCAPLGGCYTILRVGWMLKYVFLGTMWVVILDLLLADKSWKSRLFLLVICTYIAWKCDFYYINVVAGYALYHAAKNLYDMQTWIKCMMTVIAISVFCLSDFLFYSDEWNMVRAICLVTVPCVVPKMQMILNMKPLRWLGGISMSIYLLHLLVIYMVTCRLADMLPMTYFNVLMMFVVTVLLTIVIAQLYSFYVERKLVLLTDKILEKLQ